MISYLSVIYLGYYRYDFSICIIVDIVLLIFYFSFHCEIVTKELPPEPPPSPNISLKQHQSVFNYNIVARHPAMHPHAPPQPCVNSDMWEPCNPFLMAIFKIVS